MSYDAFVVATREKYRYPFNGQISTEDLWDLTPAQLDRVYKAMKKEQKASTEESLMTTKTTEDTTLENKLEIVKFIFETKQGEKLAAQRKVEEDAKKKRIREIIADKRDAELKNMSIEDLEKLL